MENNGKQWKTMENNGKQWKTIENNRKTMGTIDFRNFLCAIEKYYYFKYTDQIWCYYHHYSPFYG